MKKALLLSALVLMTLNICANEIKQAYFDHYTEKNGLPSNHIQAVCADDYGFIWIATINGLSKFDGRNFKTYTIQQYPQMLRNDFLAVANMGKGIMAIGGYNGTLLTADTRNDIFEDRTPQHFEDTYYRSTRKIYISKDKQAYAICSDGGIYKYTKGDSTYKTNFGPFDALKNEGCYSLLIDKNGRYWCGMTNKLEIFTSDGDKIFEYASKKRDAGFVNSIIETYDKTIVSTSSNEIWIFDSYTNNIEEPRTIETPFTDVIAMEKDTHDRFWIATDGNGLWYCDNITSQQPDFTEIIPYGASRKDIRKIYGIAEDNRGIIWIATQNSGLWAYRYPSKNGINTSAEYGMQKMVCSGFAEDNAGNIYISSDGEGLQVMNSKTNAIEHIGITSNILNIRNTSRQSDRLYLSTWGNGLIEYDTKTRKTRNIDFAGISNQTNCIFNTTYNSKGETFASTAGDAIYIDKGNGLWERSIPKDTLEGEGLWIMKVVEGGKDTTWVLTTNNLWIMHNDKYKAVMPEKEFDHTHTPLLQFDATWSNNKLFIATNKGTYVVSEKGTKVEKLDSMKLNGFQSVILTDNENNLWIAGNDGVMKYDTKNKEVYHILGNTNSDGKISFYSRAGLKTTNGKLYLGCNSGFISIDPELTKRISPIEYFSIKWTNSDGNGIKPSDNRIELSHSNASAQVSVDLVDFDKFSETRIRYRLKGLDEDWTYAAKDCRTIELNHLPTGNYSLEVEAFKTGAESKMIETKIRVLPAWWASWWFKTLILLVLALITFAIMEWRTRRLSRAKADLEKKVNEQTKELRLALTDKDRIIKVVAHDLKGPMYGIVSSLENWIDRNTRTMNEKERKPIVDIYDSSQQLQRELQKLLDWAKNGNVSTTWKTEDVDAREIINNVFALLKYSAQNKKISLTSRCNLENYISADKKSLETIIRNIVGNSLKFTNEGGHIGIDVCKKEQRAYISIKDDGIGISEEKLAKLREDGVHQTTTGTNNEIGTGLGLDICMAYTRRNNGHMVIESEPNKGTTITLDFELGSVIEEAAESTKEETPAIKTEIDTELLKGNKIMVVDDDSLIRESLEAKLSNYCAACSAADGLDALEKMQKDSIDIIVSDVSMPRMNGIELGKKILGDKQHNHIPLLYISANNEEDDRLLGLLTGAVDYISKPFNTEELLMKLCNILRLRQNIQQHQLNELIISGNIGEIEEKEDSKDKLNPDLKSFIQFVEKNYTNPDLQIEEIASTMCMSQSTLNRRIKSLTGKAPVEVLSDFRLGKARQMLKKGEVTVGDVAFKVGFADASYFARRYKMKFGFTPSQTIGLGE